MLIKETKNWTNYSEFRDLALAATITR